VIGQTGLLILLAGGAPTVMFFNQSSGQPQFTPNGGLFGDVKSTVIKGNDEIYVGGQFSASADQTVQRLNNLAMLDLVSNKWRPVGNGTEGPVDRLRFDKLRNTIHLFGENVLEGFRHAVYNLDNQQIGPDSQSPQSFDIAFDLNNIYYIGSFPNYKTSKS
jgi:hypothetical protein